MNRRGVSKPGDKTSRGKIATSPHRIEPQRRFNKTSLGEIGAEIEKCFSNNMNGEY